MYPLIASVMFGLSSLLFALALRSHILATDAEADESYSNWTAISFVSAISGSILLSMLFLVSWSPLWAWERSYWLHDLKVGDTVTLDVDNAPPRVLSGFGLFRYFPVMEDRFPSFMVSNVHEGCPSNIMVGRSFHLDYRRYPGATLSLALISDQIDRSSRAAPDFRYRMQVQGTGFGCVSEVLVNAESLALFKMHAKLTGHSVATGSKHALARNRADDAVAVVGNSVEQGKDAR